MIPACSITTIFLLCILFARKLTHPHIVKFYGTNLQHSRNGTKVLIVLELCSCSLRSWVISHPKNAPARLSSEDVKKKVLGWVLNILDALQYIHDEGFVHRDLNLDNILVSWISKFSSRTLFFSLSFISISWWSVAWAFPPFPSRIKSSRL